MQELTNGVGRAAAEGRLPGPRSPPTASLLKQVEDKTFSENEHHVGWEEAGFGLPCAAARQVYARCALSPQV